LARCPQQPSLLFFRSAFRGTTSDDNTCPGFGGSASDHLMFTLDGRIGNLEYIKYTHGNVILQGGSVPDMPMNRTLPTSLNCITASRKPFSSNVCFDGEMSNCARSS
jgi:hypothetical protein